MAEERHILIVEDNEADAVMLCRTLQKSEEFAYTFTIVMLGEQALQVCQTLRPTCIFLDYYLPDMSGIDILKELRQTQTELSFVPVILLTGQGNEYIATQAIQSGAQDYIKKSDYTLERLNTSIGSAVEYMRLKSALYDLEQQRAELFRLEKVARLHAEEANRVKIQFMGMISHEMGGPLASMRTLADSMQSDKATLDQAKKILKMIGSEAERLYDLVGQLLDLSRMQAATLTIKAEAKHFSDLLESAQMQLEAMTPNHRLVINLSNDLPTVWIDSRRILQILLNLVNNAVKFSPHQTTITLNVMTIPEGIQVEVLDEGIGIPHEKRELVFEPFQQLVGANQSIGTGLGLAICKGIIEAHSGHIWIADNVERGTKFCFVLPAFRKMKEDSSYHKLGSGDTLTDGLNGARYVPRL